MQSKITLKLLRLGYKVDQVGVDEGVILFEHEDRIL